MSFSVCWGWSRGQVSGREQFSSRAAAWSRVKELMAEKVSYVDVYSVKEGRRSVVEFREYEAGSKFCKWGNWGSYGPSFLGVSCG